MRHIAERGVCFDFDANARRYAVHVCTLNATMFAATLLMMVILDPP
ncbi:MAG: hypothetical protein IPH23_00970 [Gammaproteobacteria bacterium]|nr:hypothetical protein [Gammaproteobacteria bacterium]